VDECKSLLAILNQRPEVEVGHMPPRSRVIENMHSTDVNRGTESARLCEHSPCK
jgi:hypothetical protein